MRETIGKLKTMCKEMIDKEVIWTAVADYIIAREEQAKKDVAEKALKAILSGNSQEIDNFRNYCKELGQTQDK